MPNCVAHRCFSNTRKKDLNVSFHCFPPKNQRSLRNSWVRAVQKREADLPAKPFLCSLHFEDECFDKSFALRASLLQSDSSRQLKRRLRYGAVPTIFYNKPLKLKVRWSSVNRLERKHRQEVLSELLECNTNSQDNLQQTSVLQERCEVATQTDPYQPKCTHAHTQTEYDRRDVGTSCSIPCKNDVGIMTEKHDIDCRTDQQLPDDEDIHDSDETYYMSSQETYSQSSTEDPFETNDDQLIFVHKDNLKQLLHYCPICGGIVELDNVHAVENQGTIYSVKLVCINGCSYTWKSQKDVKDVRNSVNIKLTAAITLSGIAFTKFQQMASLLNLKTIGNTTFYKLRSNYVLPAIENEWKKEQTSSITSVNAREESLMLAGDGRCDSPGHSAKYGTYTLLDTETDKVLDFEVVQVMEVNNSNAMEKEGLIRTLSRIENEHNCEVYGISTDRHTQIKKYMREEHKDKVHQLDPWHLCKSISKKINSAAKKKNCGDLSDWRPSIINHFWWAVDSCEDDPDNLVERFTSVVHHVVNRHKWPGCKLYKKCDHARLPRASERKKKWLKPSSPSHKALVKIVKNKRILTDLRQCCYGIATTMLEVYHSLYLKYLPKIQHFSYEMMVAGTQLAALDHNNNIERNQAVMEGGERDGERRFKIKWSKVTKKFTAQPVLEKKTYGYLHDIIAEALKRAEMKLEPERECNDRKRSMAPQQREHRNIIIENTIKFCRLSS